MKIYFVDENNDQRNTYRDMLRRGLPNGSDTPEVLGVAPMTNLSDMDYLVQDPEVGAIILDERLKDLGTATYFGIELASHLRALDPNIPIYILTNEPDSEEIEGNQAVVEGILSKQSLRKDIDVVCSRILRGINTYTQIKTERENKFEELVRKSMSDKLTPDEEESLKNMDFYRSRAHQVDEIAFEKDCDRLRALDDKLKHIEGLLNKP
jgi:DNA-binding NarL/FixJ family response regulator